MYVPSYQMHNVLKVYSNKLRHTISSKDQRNSEKLPVDQLDLTSGRKRRATIEKVSKEILDKIIRFGTQTDSAPNGRSEHVTSSQDKECATAIPNKAGFIFNIIDTINKKTTNTVSVEDSRFLIQRLEQLSKDTIET